MSRLDAYTESYYWVQYVVLSRHHRSLVLGPHHWLEDGTPIYESNFHQIIADRRLEVEIEVGRRHQGFRR